MAADQVTLERPYVRLRDTRLGQRTEAGVDPVDRPALVTVVDDGVNRGPSPTNPTPSIRMQPNRAATLANISKGGHRKGPSNFDLASTHWTDDPKPKARPARRIFCPAIQLASADRKKLSAARIPRRKKSAASGHFAYAAPALEHHLVMRLRFFPDKLMAKCLVGVTAGMLSSASAFAQPTDYRGDATRLPAPMARASDDGVSVSTRPGAYDHAPKVLLDEGQEVTFEPRFVLDTGRVAASAPSKDRVRFHPPW